MKTIIVSLGKLFLKFIYFFIKLLPVKKQIVFISMQSNKPSLDFTLLSNEIKQQNNEINIVFLCKKMKSSLCTKKDYISYVWNMIGYVLKTMYYLATSKVCITESYCVPISILKHKNQLTIIQIWHASGAVKKFGYQCLDTEEGKSKKVAELMCMHKNYDYIIAPSEATKEIFAEAFNIEKEKIAKLGLPRLEYIVNPEYDKSEEFYKQYPTYKNKKIILYVPTFRKGKKANLEEILSYRLDKEKYQLIIKLHPLENSCVPEEYTVDSNYTSYDLIKIADYIITDYSILSIEASLLEKPIFPYLYDLEDYIQNRGLNINLNEELKTFTSKNFNDIMNKIETQNYDIQEIKNYRNKYIEINSSKATKDLTDFVLEQYKKKEEKVYRYEKKIKEIN